MLKTPPALDAGFMAATAVDPARVRRLRRQLARVTGPLALPAPRQLLSWEGCCGLPDHGYRKPHGCARRPRASTTYASLLARTISSSRCARRTDAFDDIRIVVYLRRQDDFVESMYTQKVQEGASGSFAEFLRGFDATEALDYERLLDAFARRFGAHNLVVRRHGPGAVADFGRALGIAALQAPRAQRHDNPAMSQAALEIARCTNAQLDERQRRRLRRVLQSASPKPVGHGFRFFGPDQRAAFMERHAGSNARVAARWFAEGPPTLFAPLRHDAASPVAATPALQAEQVAPILVHLLSQRPAWRLWKPRTASTAQAAGGPFSSTVLPSGSSR